MAGKWLLLDENDLQAAFFLLVIKNAFAENNVIRMKKSRRNNVKK